MLSAYGAYLVRCWWDGTSIHRVEVRHVQSGRKVVLRSTTEALCWIDENCSAPSPSPSDAWPEEGGGDAGAAQ